MADFTNNLDDTLDQIMFDLDLEKDLAETQAIASLMDKLAPQEMDRLVSVLSMGVRQGLTKIIKNQIKDNQQQSLAISTSVAKELQDASGDFGINDLEKQFNVDNFCGRVFQALPELA